MPALTVSVVIPSRNGKRLLARCLPALARTRLPPGASLQTIVVDNGSSDGTEAWLTSRPEVDTLIFPEPLGFAHANNAARAVARGEVVVFLNNDTEVHPEWLSRPLEIFAADPRVAAVGSKLVFLHRFAKVVFHLREGRAFVLADHYGSAVDGKVRWGGPVGPLELRLGRPGRWVQNGAVLYLPILEPDLDGARERAPSVTVAGREPEGPVAIHTGARETLLARTPAVAVVDPSAAEETRLIQNAGSFVTREGAGGDVGTGVEDGPTAYGGESEVPSICGAALIVRRTSLDAAGWFPAYYTMYYEDTDLCLRLRQAAGRLVYCPSSVVYHYHTGTNREFSPAFIEHVARSSILFVARFGDARLLARHLADRLRHTRAEFASSRRRPWRERWRSAHGTRGAIHAIAALPRVLAEHSWDAVRGRPLAGALLGTPRLPYPADEVRT